MVSDHLFVFVYFRVAPPPPPFPTIKMIHIQSFDSFILNIKLLKTSRLNVISTTVTCAREEVVSVFVEGHGHDSISEVERFLYSVAMMNVNINVQHSRVVPSNRKISSVT